MADNQDTSSEENTGGAQRGMSDMPTSRRRVSGLVSIAIILVLVVAIVATCVFGAATL